MLKNTTWMMKAATIASKPELSSILARLMISVNDIAIVADANDLWAKETDARRKPRQNAARQYFVRVLLSHVNEALEIVYETGDSAILREAVDKCDHRTVTDFKELEAISKEEREQFRKFRSRTTFHYDKQLPDRVLKEIAKNVPDRPWSYSMGREPLDWQFELADAIIDRMVIREVMGLKMPKSSKRTEFTAEIAGRLQDISRKYTGFAAHFVRRHCR
jgi:hypothetical protein